jgi:hypothetical protein
MKRVVSVVERRADGKLAIVMDKREIQCDENHTGIQEIIAERKSKGSMMVTLFLDDDSIAPGQWVAPPASAPAAKDAA